MPSPIRCGACEAPATYRYALARWDETAADALITRSLYRCPTHAPIASTAFLRGIAPRLLVVDPAFTARTTPALWLPHTPGDVLASAVADATLKAAEGTL